MNPEGFDEIDAPEARLPEDRAPAARAEPDRSSPGFRLPGRRHRSPWASRATVLACLVVAALLAPLWLDPVTLGELRGESATPVAPEPTIAEPAPDRPRRTARPVLTARDLAADGFERRLRDGLGEADRGGAYTLSGGAAQVEVLSGRATVRLSADAIGLGLLRNASGQELDASVTVTLDRAVREGEATAAVVLRASPEVAYRPGVTFDGESIAVVIDVVAGGVARRVAGPVELTDLAIGADAVRIRAQVSGSDPATINVRAWPVSGPEPVDWTLSVIDWTGQLQASGAAGLAWHRIGGAGRAPLVLTFDDLAVATTDAVARR